MRGITIAGIIFVVGAALMLLIALFRKRNSFFNVRHIVWEHLKLFSSCKLQYVVFYGIPLLLAVGLSFLHQAGKDFFSSISVILGIILSMLFAILSILAGQDISYIADDEKRERASQVIQETINAIVFNCLLSLFLLLYSLIMIEVMGIETLPGCAKGIFSGIAYYFFCVILFTLLLIVKHVSKLIEFHLHIKKGNHKE